MCVAYQLALSSMLRKRLKDVRDHNLPPAAFQAFTDACKSIRQLQRRYFADGTNKLDLDDSESEAIVAALAFITQKLKKDKKSKNWPQPYWYKHIMRRVQNAILEYSKYVYLPIVVPRPLRFSMKKYADALKIINRYVKAVRDVTDSNEYYVIFVKGCNLLQKPCVVCELNYSKCPISEISAIDRKELNSLIRGGRKSLEFYAQWYRKTLEEWIRTLETLRTYAGSNHIPEIPIIYDFDGEMELKRFQSRLDDLHPDLYAIYISSLETTHLEDLDAGAVITPRGWDNKTLKNKYDLTSQQFREMLLNGDKVLNEFRLNEGLPTICRDIQIESLGQKTV